MRVNEQEIEDPEGIVERMMQSLSSSSSYLQSYYAIPSFSSGMYDYNGLIEQ